MATTGSRHVADSQSNHWFKITVRIPKEFEKYERIQLEFDMSGEAMVFDTEGNVYQGMWMPGSVITAGTPSL